MVYEPDDIYAFKEKARFWASSFSTVCIMDSNGYPDPYGSLSFRIAVGEKYRYQSSGKESIHKLQSFLDEHHENFIPGYFSYDQDTFFFVPETVLTINCNAVEVEAKNPDEVIRAIETTQVEYQGASFKGKIQSRMSRDEYRDAFNSLKKHILRGDIYEVNLCQEFYADDAKLNPLEAYIELNAVSPTPFSCFFKHDEIAIMSASPERFLCRDKDLVISQPIKGTAPRGRTEAEDQNIIEKLKSSPKERSENIMIVDLVRNDLTISAEPGTVKVEELLGLYSFKQVHQLISTISCRPKQSVTPTSIITNTFPPGSMTGAPKVSAMKLIEKYEASKRGIYSGSVGYFQGNRKFDFNVVIRSLIYNSKQQYLSFHVGGAVTAQSHEEEEYNECILKASAIRQMLSKHKTT